MSKSLILLLLPSLVLSDFSVDISQPHVAIAGQVEPVTLECASQDSLAHQYCCWTGPGSDECSCDEKYCPIEARVESDQQRCKITLKNPALYKGDWSCGLYFIKHGVQKNATTQIFVLDQTDQPDVLPLFSQELVLDQDKENIPVEFECRSESTIPWQTYHWFLAGRQLGSNTKIVKFDLSRDDFNHSLECEIEQRTKESGGQVLESKGHLTLSFSMNPMIKNIVRSQENQYEIQVESWPKPNFVRISAVEECNNQCVIYEVQEDKYIMNTSPYLDTSSLIKELSVQQESGAKVVINLSLQPNQSQAIEELYVGVGNSVNVAKARIDLKSQNDRALQMSSDQDMILIIVIICLVVICVVILLALAIHFRTYIWESFKCGVYLVPPEDDEEEIEKGQEGKNKGQL